MTDFRDADPFGPVTRDQERAVLRRWLDSRDPVRVQFDLGPVLAQRDRNAREAAAWAVPPRQAWPVLSSAGLRERAAGARRAVRTDVARSTAPTRGPDRPVWALTREGCSGMA